jgi:hypothetical protein
MRLRYYALFMVVMSFSIVGFGAVFMLDAIPIVAFACAAGLAASGAFVTYLVGRANARYPDSPYQW